jgi:hypothetical protein
MLPAVPIAVPVTLTSTAATTGAEWAIYGEIANLGASSYVIDVRRPGAAIVVTDDRTGGELRFIFNGMKDAIPRRPLVDTRAGCPSDAPPQAACSGNNSFC